MRRHISQDRFLYNQSTPQYNEHTHSDTYHRTYFHSTRIHHRQPTKHICTYTVTRITGPVLIQPVYTTNNKLTTCSVTQTTGQTPSQPHNVLVCFGIVHPVSVLGWNITLIWRFDRWSRSTSCWSIQLSSCAFCFCVSGLLNTTECTSCVQKCSVHIVFTHNPTSQYWTKWTVTKHVFSGVLYILSLHTNPRVSIETKQTIPKHVVYILSLHTQPYISVPKQTSQYWNKTNTAKTCVQ